MTLATRLNVLFFVCTLMFAGLLCTLELQQNYQQQASRLLASSAAAIQGRAGLELHIHRNDPAALAKVLGEVTAGLPVRSAGIYDASGSLLASLGPDGADLSPKRAMQAIRRDLAPTEQSLGMFDSNGRERPPGLFRSYLYDFPDLYLSMPILSLVSPGVESVDAAVLAKAVFQGNKSDSNWVLGHALLAADNRAIFDAAWRASQGFFQYTLATVLLCAVVFTLYIRRITRPLRLISEAAQRIAGGNLSEPLLIKAAGEIGEIASRVDHIRGNVQSHNARQSMIHRLLTRQVAEREKIISERDSALEQAEKEANQRRIMMRRLANYDRLTHLPNRQLFAEQLKLLLKLRTRKDSRLALLLIDFKDYKQINESMGIGYGDAVLREVSRRLSATVRGSEDGDTLFRPRVEVAVSRLGGAEFAILLDEIDSEQIACEIARKVIDALSQVIRIEDRELQIRPRVGMAMAPAHGNDMDSLLRSAGIAKLHAAEQDNDAAIFYTNAMSAEARRREQVERDLGLAIERNELALHYQPQIDLNSGSVVGAEAFLRWTHGELGLQPAADVIRIAEETGMIDTLGDWILREACRQLRRFNTGGVRLPKVAINVSALQFNWRFARRIINVVAEERIPPSQLELSLSESIMTSNDPDTIRALETLKRSGIYLSVDDFGSGCSALSYLSNYPLDELKISRHFLLDCHQNEGSGKLIAAIISMAKTLDLRVSATGVETPRQLEFLRQAGAGLAQGYLMSRPVPAEALAPMLAPWHFIRQLQEISTQDSDIRIA